MSHRIGSYLVPVSPQFQSSSYLSNYDSCRGRAQKVHPKAEGERALVLGVPLGQRDGEALEGHVVILGEQESRRVLNPRGGDRRARGRSGHFGSRELV